MDGLGIPKNWTIRRSTSCLLKIMYYQNTAAGINQRNLQRVDKYYKTFN